MTLEELKALKASGQFHHATYRNLGTLWEGLWIYKSTPGWLRGFDVAGSFPKGSEDEEAAYELVRGTGVSVGSFGNG